MHVSQVPIHLGIRLLIAVTWRRCYQQLWVLVEATSFSAMIQVCSASASPLVAHTPVPHNCSQNQDTKLGQLLQPGCVSDSVSLLCKQQGLVLGCIVSFDCIFGSSIWR